MKKLLFTLALFAVTVAPACKTTPTNPDSFYQVVVTCTVDNSSNTQAAAAVYQCLSDVILSQDYAGCLAGLVTAGTWTVDEVACLVRHYAQTSAQRINKGTVDALDQTALDNANAWLKKEQPRFKTAN
jgi:hypothetical protein